MTVGGKPAFFMIGGIMELDKNNVITTIHDYLLDENLELYDINIVNFDNDSVSSSNTSGDKLSTKQDPKELAKKLKKLKK